MVKQQIIKTQPKSYAVQIKFLKIEGKAPRIWNLKREYGDNIKDTKTQRGLKSH